MQYEWILDVLTDLKAFAKANGLTALAEQLDDTSLVAASEIAQFVGETDGGPGTDARSAGMLHRGFATGNNS
jgi:hypothetical protein